MNKTLFVFACLVFAAFSSAQTPDRSTAPRPGPAPSLRLPVIQKQVLGNGLKVWLVEHREVPIVQVNLLFHSGSSADPAGKFGLASLTAAMLDEGAGTRSALELEEMIVYQLPEDSFSNYVAAIQAVSAADVQRAATRYIQPAISAVVIVGDRQKIETGIKALGLAPVRIVPIDEVMEK